MTTAGEPPFPDYKILREIPFAASPELRAYHDLVVEQFDALLPLHRAVYEARAAEHAKGWDYETSYSQHVRPHQAKLEEVSKAFTARYKALPDIAEGELTRYRAARMTRWYAANNVSATDTQTSPSGRYRLVRTTHPTDPGTWAYSQGHVYVGDRLVAKVRRNYHSFWFAWVEGHPKGDFLLCGYDYRGQTVITLPEGDRDDCLPGSAAVGGGFCWAHAEPSPDMRLLAVDGCVWGGPYETRIFNFDNPAALPYENVGPTEVISNGFRWNPDSSIGFIREFSVRKSDGKKEYDLTDAEWEAIAVAEEAGGPSADLWEDRTEVIGAWAPPRP